MSEWKENGKWPQLFQQHIKYLVKTTEKRVSETVNFPKKKWKAVRLNLTPNALLAA